MTDKATTHGESIILATAGHSYLEQEMEASTVSSGKSLRNLFAGSGMPVTATLDLEQRLRILQWMIDSQQQIIEAQKQEMRRLQQLVYSMPQHLESLAMETSEILDLQPLSRRRVNAKVRKYYEPAPFHVIEDAEDTDSEATEE